VEVNSAVTRPNNCLSDIGMRRLTKFVNLTIIKSLEILKSKIYDFKLFADVLPRKMISCMQCLILKVGQPMSDDLNALASMKSF